MVRTLAVLALLALAACGFVPRVGANMPGETLRVHAASYEQVWQASFAAVNDIFPRTYEDGKAHGEILAGSNGCAYGPGNYLGVYITPTTPAAEMYFIKIVADRESKNAGPDLARTMRDKITAALAATGATAEAIPVGGM